MCHEGWLKLYRNIMGKPIWKETTAEQKVVLITILLRAAYTQRTWVYRGVKYNLKPGQLITSINSLVEMGGHGVTHRKVRTSLDVLEKYGFLTQQTTTQNTLITVENWETYQLDTLQPTQKTSQQRHSDDTAPSQGVTTIKKLRNKEGIEGVERIEETEEKRLVFFNEIENLKAENQKTTATKDVIEADKITENEKRREVETPAPVDEVNVCTNEDLDQVLTLFHQHCPSFPGVRKFTEKRLQQVVACWGELKKTGDGPVLALVEEAFVKAERSPFLKGHNSASWRADFDWLTKPENFLKVLEGKYEPFPKAVTGEIASGKTKFHLPESRKEGYTNDQLEALLLKKRQKHQENRRGGR